MASCRVTKVRRQVVHDERVGLWKRRLQQFRKSGLTRKAFCSKNRLKLSTLDYWFSRIRKSEAIQGMVELKTTATPVVDGGLEVVVAGRYRVEVRRGFDAPLLGELIKALETLG